MGGPTFQRWGCSMWGEVLRVRACQGLMSNGKGRSKMQEVLCFHMLAESTSCAKGISLGLKYISLWKVSGRWMRGTAPS